MRRLPYGYRTVWWGDTSYFYLRGIFYERVPSGYVVVKSPPETLVVKETSVFTEQLEPGNGQLI